VLGYANLLLNRTGGRRGVGKKSGRRDCDEGFRRVVHQRRYSASSLPKSAVVRFDGDFRQGEQVTLTFDPGVLEYP
jgi:hypothetical protein